MEEYLGELTWKEALELGFVDPDTDAAEAEDEN